MGTSNKHNNKSSPFIQLLQKEEPFTAWAWLSQNRLIIQQKTRAMLTSSSLDFSKEYSVIKYNAHCML